MPEPLLPPTPTDESFTLLFRDPTFGLEAARYLCAKHGYHVEPVRVTSGCNLNFRVGDNVWLKICPSVNSGDAATERWMLEYVYGRLPVRTPEVTASGEIDGWEYVFATHVEGIQFDKIKLEQHDRVRIANDVGATLAALHALPINGFKRSDTTWETFLDDRLASVANRTRTSGADERWTDMAVAFMETQRDALVADTSRVLAHADLYADHLLMTDASGRWEIAGIIDFADTLIAPREYDLIDPMLWLFRGDRESIVAMLEAFGMSRASMDEAFARRMLAWYIVHRFHSFGNAFKRELLDANVQSMDDLARQVFP